MSRVRSRRRLYYRIEGENICFARADRVLNITVSPLAAFRSISQNRKQPLPEPLNRFLVTSFPILKGLPKTKALRTGERSKDNHQGVEFAPASERTEYMNGQR